jgi:light-regulated signal transduction histidine kinase (bacteriophytochrome)
VTTPLDGFGQSYVDALGAYLQRRDEGALSRAYELGRSAMARSLGVLDMASLHQAAVSVLVVSAPAAEQLQLAAVASSFFAELLSPFEMSFRGYRAANDELQRLNESLRQQKEAVELANRELESFSYSVSHDLRAPLRSIDAFSQYLIEDHGDALGDEGKRYAVRIHGAARHMAILIDKLLTLARVTRAEIQRADVSLTELARRAAEWLRAAAPDRDVEVIVDDDLRCNGDAALLALVVENLLGNAWKFTSKRVHAEIRFGRELHEGRPRYFVRDNGSGFDMALAQKLFAPFQRLHSASEFEGTGIGLATVQRIVQRHNGQVWADGEIDRGATFYFTLGTFGGGP